ncbi:UDP-N-acetylmuramoyl-tripeptide--D-alanyl-D-alanine ligase [Aciduricibacillus chroicocephali]|uniref:UDP-N-acetylmuramoyl-tripeptide--D-alanyl-D-alanine ligase n=1 Tax=Aciduricibacillus chroicocephali TaxID=3054939 RepID=A0ABY9KY72_9BACI|nr:UDP-N-acetylmuramoyl-tripeptide--D-alanyl-D-alanine ligase [Bacillaceae bacterium 44XB]
MFAIDFLQQLFPDNQLNGKFAGDEISQVSTDSRGDLSGSLFVPLRGDRFDGHDFAKGAVEAGAVAVLWDRTLPVPGEIHSSAAVFFVEDTLLALQQLAQSYRKLVDPRVIGITGSNGKTTTKDLVAAVLGTSLRTHWTKGNLNNHIGVPLTILGMPRDTEMLIVEMGMNHAGEIELLSNIAQPDYAIITNIGESHIEYLGSREGIAAAKLEIVSGLSNEGKLIIDGDEPLLETVHDSSQTITCGFSNACQLQIVNASVIDEGTIFSLRDGTEFKVGLYGRHHAKNASYAIALGRLLGISDAAIREGLANIMMTGMRFQKVEGRNGAMLINDAYNASPTSMKAAIDVVREMDGYERKIVILGDIFELGSHAQELHISVAPHIKEPIDALFTYGELSKLIGTKVNELDPQIATAHYSDANGLVQALEPYLEAGTVLLFKASRGMKMEQVINLLAVQETNQL